VQRAGAQRDRSWALLVRERQEPRTQEVIARHLGRDPSAEDSNDVDEGIQLPTFSRVNENDGRTSSRNRPPTPSPYDSCSRISPAYLDTLAVRKSGEAPPS